MPKIHSIVASFAFDGPMVNRECHSVSFTKGNDFDLRLHARLLFRQYKFVTRELTSRLREQNRDLNRENILSIKVVVEAVEVAWSVLQQ